MTDFHDVARRFGGRRGATNADLARLEEYAGTTLPDAYREFATLADGAEGWIGDEYVALWPSAEVPDHNTTLNVDSLAPGLLIIGTNGGGEAYAIDFAEGGRLVSVPLVGLSRELALEVADSFGDWLSTLARANPKAAAPPGGMGGMNVYEKTPVILGGDPTDPANKAVVPLRQILSIARWWNERLPHLRQHGR